MRRGGRPRVAKMNQRPESAEHPDHRRYRQRGDHRLHRRSGLSRRFERFRLHRREKTSVHPVLKVQEREYSQVSRSENACAECRHKHVRWAYHAELIARRAQLRTDSRNSPAESQVEDDVHARQP